MIENYLTTEQVATILQVHPFTILKFIKQGKLKGVKLGRVYRLKESDVQEFLESRMTKSHSKVQEIKPPETKVSERQPRELKNNQDSKAYELSQEAKKDQNSHYQIKI